MRGVAWMTVPLNESTVATFQGQLFGGGAVAGRKILIYSREGIGKTVLACRLGQHNLIITDEDGYTALENDSVRGLIGHWQAIPFKKWVLVAGILQAVEFKQLKC